MTSTPITAICPGSYDPVTNGHLDIIRRAAAVFDRIVVGVVAEPHHKQTLFSADERIAFLEEALAETTNVVVEASTDFTLYMRDPDGRRQNFVDRHPFRARR